MIALAVAASVAMICASALIAWRWWIAHLAVGRVSIDAKWVEAKISEAHERINRIEVQRMGL